ncbi:MAG TPA: hypothetical protein PLF81_25010 [Candidatus Anammoximicrobium sp.]|nr:hypothetical protein [Candidatus Anammoximicrobium sp.]
MKPSRLAAGMIVCLFMGAGLLHESRAAQNAPPRLRPPGGGTTSDLHESPAGQNAARRELALTVRDMTGLDGLRPVTGGVPLAAGAAPRGAAFVLTGEQGGMVPCQSRVLTRWKDGSARWVLLDFQAAPPPDGTARFTLRWNGQGDAPAPRLPVQTVDEAKGILQTGTMRFSPADDGVLSVGERLDVRFTLIDGAGRRCRAVVESCAVEAGGPVRGTLLLRGAFRAPDESRVLGFRLRASVFAGLSRVLLEPHLLVDAESGVLHRLRGLSLDVVPRSPLKGVQLGGAAKESSGASVRLLQVDDETCRFEGVEGTGSKAPGWAELTDAAGTVAVALRDFWQQWPKSIEAEADGLKIGLFPTFSAGTFAHMEPWYKHQYLFDGDCYQLRMGQSRRWQIWLDVQGGGDALVRSANAPLVPAADPAQAIAAGTWGPIAAAGSPGLEDYDRWAENLFVNGYLNSIHQQRDYGAMNWGDWWGERGCNWGNHEYDTPKQILVQFARTGDPRYLYVGDTAARHTSEVDVIQFVNADLTDFFHKTAGRDPNYPIRPGMVHEHCVGHVSGFYPVDRIRELYVSLGIGKTDRPYLCLDPYNLGHIWTQGMVYDYFLTGDPWLKETVEKIGANLAQLVEDRKFSFKGGSHSGRVNGWTMLAIAGAYELDFDDRYLKAMKLLADDALSEQDPETGGWRYKLPWGHCYCETKHWGEATFIGAIRLNGLSKYYELTGDPRIPEAVRRGVAHINRDTWEEQYSGWRYTSCPKSGSGPGRQDGVIVMALVNSVSLTGDADQLRVLRQAWEAKFERLLVAPTSGPGLGKTYSTIMYGCPEAMHLFVKGP